MSCVHVLDLSFISGTATAASEGAIQNWPVYSQYTEQQ